MRGSGKPDEHTSGLGEAFAWAGIDLARSRFGGPVALKVDGREFLHMHTRGEVHVRLTAETKKVWATQLRMDPGVLQGARSRDWTSFRVENTARALLGRVEIAYHAYRL